MAIFLNNKKQRLQMLLLFGCSLFFFSCAATSTVGSPSDLRQSYENAVKDAETVEPQEIALNLNAIVAYNKSLIWQNEPGNSKVLVVTWTGWGGYDGKVGERITATREIWITAAPELKNFCTSQSLPLEALTLRLEQLMGLPPGSGKTQFVEIWADPEDMFRPSPDPEITDHEAELDFPSSTRFLTVSAEHIQWFRRLKEKSYGEDGYPWARLGYTYDWGNPANRQGLSEFVIRQGAEVEIKGVAAIDSYCR